MKPFLNLIAPLPPRAPHETDGCCPPKRNWDSTPKYHPNPRNINEMLDFNIYEQPTMVTHKLFEKDGKVFYNEAAYERYTGSMKKWEEDKFMNGYTIGYSIPSNKIK